VFVLGIALNYPVYTSHTVAMRLYRPGYDLVEIDSWQLPEKVAWKKAPDLAAQEKELDRLMLTTDEASRPAIWLGRTLRPGSASAAHRQALLFGASEYERLAASAQSSHPNPNESSRRLVEKAGTLRALADK
jgi:hypothetical protein